MGIRHRLAHLEEQAAAILDGNASVAAPVVDAETLHIIHHQERASFRRGAAIDQTRDVRMVQARQNLAFMPEPEEQFRRVHTGSDELEGGLLLKLGVVADRQVDDAHAAAADLTAHPPGTKPRAYGRVAADHLLRGGFHRQVDVVRMGAIRHEQRIDIPAEIRVAPASAFEKALLFGGRQVGRREKYFLNLLPVVRHGLASEVHLSPRVMRKTGADFLGPHRFPGAPFGGRCMTTDSPRDRVLSQGRIPAGRRPAPVRARSGWPASRWAADGTAPHRSDRQPAHSAACLLRKGGTMAVRTRMTKQAWFGPKRLGWGLAPRSWQGWLVGQPVQVQGPNARVTIRLGPDQQHVRVAAASGHQWPRCARSSRLRRLITRAEPPGSAAASGCPMATAPIGRYCSGTPNRSLNCPISTGGMPKNSAPSCSSTALSSMSRAMKPVSISQYGTGQRASSRSVHPLSCRAYLSR